MFTNLQLILVIVGFVFPSITKQQENDPAYLQNLSTISDGCAQQNGLSNDYLMALPKSSAPFPNDDKLKCYFSCLCLKMGVIDETGDVKEDALKVLANELFNDSIEADIVKNCDVPKDGDLCAPAFKLMQCVHKESFD